MGFEQDCEKWKLLVTPELLEQLVKEAWPGCNLMNAYLFGSRLYGVHKESSDFDFIGITTGHYYYAYRVIEHDISITVNGLATLISININMMHINYFLETLHDSFINSIMLVYLPSAFIWKEDINIKPELSIRYPNLRQAVHMDTTHNFAKSKRLWRLGDFYTSKKNIVHGLRYLHYTLQILSDKGTIFDWTEGNEYWQDLMSLENPCDCIFQDPDLAASLNDPVKGKKIEHDPKKIEHAFQVCPKHGKSWNDFWIPIEIKYQPIFNDLTRKMKELCDKWVEDGVDYERQWEKTNPKDKSDIPSYQILIDLIGHYGIDGISKYFGIVVKRHQTFKELIHLSRTWQSPLEMKSVQFCSGIVLDENEGFKPVCLSFPKIFATSSDKHLLPIIEYKDSWSSAEESNDTTKKKKKNEVMNESNFIQRIEPLIEGKSACLYYYGSEWNIATRDSPDGSELVGWKNPCKMENWNDFVDEGFNFNPIHQSMYLSQLYSDGRPNPTFREYFLQFASSKYRLKLSDLNPRFIYVLIFEDPLFSLVTSNSDRKLYLAALRDSERNMMETVLDGTCFGTFERIPRFKYDESSRILKLSENQGDNIVEYDELDAVTLDVVEESMRFLNPVRLGGFIALSKSGARLMYRTPQYQALDTLNPLSDKGQVEKCILELIRNRNDQTWILEQRFAYWIPKYQSMKNHFDKVCQFIQALWNEVKMVCLKEGRSQSAEMLAKYPDFSGELFQFIKYSQFDMTIVEHFSKIGLTKLQKLLKRMEKRFDSSVGSRSDGRNNTQNQP